MSKSIETIYILENPEKNLVKFVTDYQLRYDDVIKEVFGVACLNDLNMMIQFNKSFQDSICMRNGIDAKKISIHCIVRIATKNELLQLKEQMMTDLAQTQNSVFTIPCPFDSVIQLKDGVFKWDDEHSTYILVNQHVA